MQHLLSKCHPRLPTLLLLHQRPPNLPCAFAAMALTMFATVQILQVAQLRQLMLQVQIVLNVSALHSPPGNTFNHQTLLSGCMMKVGGNGSFAPSASVAPPNAKESISSATGIPSIVVPALKMLHPLTTLAAPAPPVAASTPVPVSPSVSSPSSNLTSVVNPNPIPPGPPDVTILPLADDAPPDDPDAIEFLGIWNVSIDDHLDPEAMVTFNPPSLGIHQKVRNGELTLTW